MCYRRLLQHDLFSWLNLYKPLLNLELIWAKERKTDTFSKLPTAINSLKYRIAQNDVNCAYKINLKITAEIYFCNIISAHKHFML